jgi:transposase, IS5 family
VVTGAKVHDKHPLPELPHSAEKLVFDDRGQQGCGEIIKAAASEARDFTNRTKSRTRARVEHAFLVLKRLWGFAKVRYRGLANRPFCGMLTPTQPPDGLRLQRCGCLTFCP